jgi:site-specific DNA recombinase
MSKVAAIYGRVSTRKQKEGENVDSQIEALSKYAQQQDYTVPKEWVLKDEGYSGASLRRPGLDVLRELIRDSNVDAVLVYSPDRLSRKFAYQMLLEMEFQKRGVQLIFLNTPKAETSEEKLMLNLKGVFAEYERAQITERARRGRHYRARQGSVSVLASAPYGYKYIKKGLTGNACFEIDPSKANIIKDIFNWYTAGQSMISICKELTQAKIPAPKGGQKWGRSTIRQILKNTAYTGTAYFGKTEVTEELGVPKIRRINGKKREKPACTRRNISNDLWIPITVPAIISEEQFAIAQEKINTNIVYSSRNTGDPSMLQGLITCGNCGHPYYKKMRPSSNGKKGFYCCSNRLKGGKCKNISILQKDLDDECWKHLIELLKTPHLIEKEIQQRAQEDTGINQSNLKRKEIQNELSRLDKAKDKLLDAYQEGECLTLSELKLRMSSIKQEHARISKALEKLDAQVIQEKNAVAIKTNLEYFLECLENSKRELDVFERQKVARLLISEIVLSEKSIKIKHSIPLASIDDGISPLCSDGYR